MARRRSLADFLNDPASGWTRLIVTQSLGLLGNLTAGVIAVVSGNPVWLAVPVLSIAALLLGIYFTRRQAEPLVLVPENQQPRKYAGLIVIIGKGRPNADPMEQSAREAIKYHLPSGGGPGLKHCWLIATTGADGSMSYAQKFKEYCEGNSVTAEILPVDDPFGVQHTYEVVRRVYETEAPKAGLAEEDVIADVTGGTSPMSIGMALACGERRSMEYMYGQPYRGEKTIASVPRLVEFRPRVRRRG